jgi:hypothetical protein
MKVAYHVVKMNSQVEVQRTCSSCGNLWFILIDVNVCIQRNVAWNSLSSVEREARDALANKILFEKKNHDVQVDCPCCGNLSVDAIEHHFPQGMKKGVLLKYKRSLFGNIPILIIISFFVPMFIGMFIESIQDQRGRVFLSILFFLFALLFTSVWGYFFFFHILRLIVYYPKIRKLVISLPDKDLYILTLDIYRNRKHSLSNIFWAADVIKILKDKKLI